LQGPSQNKFVTKIIFLEIRIEYTILVVIGFIYYTLRSILVIKRIENIEALNIILILLNHSITYMTSCTIGLFIFNFLQG